MVYELEIEAKSERNCGIGFKCIHFIGQFALFNK